MARRWKIQDGGIHIGDETQIMMAIELRGNQTFTGSKIVEAIEKSYYDKAVECLKKIHAEDPDNYYGYESEETLKELGEI